MPLTLLEQLRSKAGFTSVTTDSRQCPANSVFFALKGQNFNGNMYAQKALESGCVLAVVDEAQYAVDDRCVLVPDVLKALQDVARDYRIALGKPIIGITGTNGKTTTKELLAAVLRKKFRVHSTQGNLNNHIGVPLTLLQMTENDQIGIIEMGASHPGDIRELVEIACPNAGLITNVGKAHLLGFGSFEGVMHTKAELYDYLRQTEGFIFRNIDNPHLAEMAGDLPFHSYSMHDRTAEVFGQVTDCRGMLEMDVYADNKMQHLQTHLVGAYNVENVLAAICVGLTFGLTLSEAVEAVAGYVPQNNRSMLQHTAHNQVVVDAYNANPTSMRAAIENFAQMNISNQTLILGDMLELGEQSAAEHQAIVDLLHSHKFGQVLLVGEQFCMLHSDYPSFKDVLALKDYLGQHPLCNRYVLLKGSRGIKLETAMDLL